MKKCPICKKAFLSVEYRGGPEHEAKPYLHKFIGTVYVHDFKLIGGSFRIVTQECFIPKYKY